jgi:uncharacterized protein YcaQ
MRVQSYRGRKDTSLALYNLWLTGELMTHSRVGFERRYDLFERVAPPAVAQAAPVAEAEAFFARKATLDPGLTTLRAWAARFAGLIARKVSAAEAQACLADLQAAGVLRPVRLAGRKEEFYYPAAERELLETVQAGEVPAEWRPLTTTTRDEANLLAPLDNIVAHGRALDWFGFNHLWEIYKPASRRRWGPYTLPILYGDQLVAHLDSRLDRATGTLVLNGFWPEPAQAPDDPAFIAALGRGLARFAAFHAAPRLDLSTLPAGPIREQLRALFPP